MNAIIKPHGCKSCGHSVAQQNQLACTLNPPTAAPVFQMTQEGIMHPVGWVSSFPPVAPDLKCGQWKMRLAVASSLDKVVS